MEICNLKINVPKGGVCYRVKISISILISRYKKKIDVALYNEHHKSGEELKNVKEVSEIYILLNKSTIGKLLFVLLRYDKELALCIIMRSSTPSRY